MQKASLRALTAIHAFGVLHGDIRPQNILVPQSEQGGVRFIDFGFSRAIATEADILKEVEELLHVVGCMRLSRTAFSQRLSLNQDNLTHVTTVVKGTPTLLGLYF